MTCKKCGATLTEFDFEYGYCWECGANTPTDEPEED